jgi:hypothetical protein
LPFPFGHGTTAVAEVGAERHDVAEVGAENGRTVAGPMPYC